MSILEILKKIDEELENGEILVKEFLKKENDRKKNILECNNDNKTCTDQVLQDAYDRLEFIVLCNKRLRLDIEIDALKSKLYS